ncbi:unnamed protein product [Blumeria hordei]|uniref:Uncharacterized protein n=2 Tax=Blumeria hordei TaxID=2867405 RepID=A0A383UG71_BLUHO|nr:CSEP0097 putative effector protein [Blumeria hordei DH14]SZE99269.1 unnamed protein product [Blumeria hordei]
MKKFLLHLAIALMSVVTPAVAVMYDCSGDLIDGSIVEAEEKRVARGSTSKVCLINPDSTQTFQYFDIKTSGYHSNEYTGFRCFMGTGMTKPDVRKKQGDTWWPCDRQS